MRFSLLTSLTLKIEPSLASIPHFKLNRIIEMKTLIREKLFIRGKIVYHVNMVHVPLYTTWHFNIS